MLLGKVKWFNSVKGFGFIESAGKDYFVHFNQIIGDGFLSLNENQRVEFTPGETKKGLVASGVTIVR